MADRIPTKEEWGTCPGHVMYLDWKWTYEHYVGKSNSDVLDYLIYVPLSKAEDLQYMNRVPFRYYVRGYCECLVGRRFDPADMSDAANALLGILEYKIQYDPSCLLPLQAELMNAAQFAAEHQDEIGASREIYGTFQERLDRIKEELRSRGARFD